MKALATLGLAALLSSCATEQKIDSTYGSIEFKGAVEGALVEIKVGPPPMDHSTFPWRVYNRYTAEFGAHEETTVEDKLTSQFYDGDGSGILGDSPKDKYSFLDVNNRITTYTIHPELGPSVKYDDNYVSGNCGSQGKPCSEVAREGLERANFLMQKYQLGITEILEREARVRLRHKRGIDSLWGHFSFDAEIDEQKVEIKTEYRDGSRIINTYFPEGGIEQQFNDSDCSGVLGDNLEDSYDYVDDEGYVFKYLIDQECGPMVFRDSKDITALSEDGGWQHPAIYPYNLPHQNVVQRKLKFASSTMKSFLSKLLPRGLSVTYIQNQKDKINN